MVLHVVNNILIIIMLLAATAIYTHLHMENWWLLLRFFYRFEMKFSQSLFLSLPDP